MFNRTALPPSLAATALALLLSAAPVLAQTAATTTEQADTTAPATATAQPPSDTALEGDCVDPASQAEAATSPAPTAEGTATAGTTGWSGGTGGSQVGTNPQGAVATSKTWHAPTARGLDLMGRPEPVTEAAAQASAETPAAEPAVAVTPDC